SPPTASRWPGRTTSATGRAAPTAATASSPDPPADRRALLTTEEHLMNRHRLGVGVAILEALALLFLTACAAGGARPAGGGARASAAPVKGRSKAMGAASGGTHAAGTCPPSAPHPPPAPP